MIFKNFFKFNGDQLAVQAINDYRNGKDGFSVITKLKKALELGVKNYPLDKINLYIGCAYFDASLFEEAKVYYERALQYNKNDATVLSNLGIVYNELGDFEKSIEYYRASLQIKPDNSYAHHNIGTHLYEKGNHLEAMESLDKAIKINPMLAVAYAIKAKCWAAIGNFKESQKCFKDAGSKGYENIEVLRSELEQIKSENPNIYWNRDKFFEFVKSILPEEQLIKILNDCLKSPVEFFNLNSERFEKFYLTSFEIYNAMHWFGLINALKDKGRIIEITYDTDISKVHHSLIAALGAMSLSAEITLEDLYEDLESEFFDIEEELTEIACKLRLSHSINLLEIWVNKKTMVLCPMPVKSWEELKYPFVDVDGGFGRIRPIATEEVIKDYLLNN